MKKEKTEIDFYGGAGKIFDVLLLNVLFIICSLPIITMGASFTALYYTASENIREGKGYAAQAFLKAFGKNLFPSVFLWAAIVICSFLMHLNLGIVSAETGGNLRIFLFMFYAVCAALIVGIACYAFPVLSRFEMNVGWIIKVSIYMVFRYIGQTMGCVLMVGISGWLILKIPFLLFIIPSVMAVLSTYILEPVLKKHYPKEAGEQSHCS